MGRIFDTSRIGMNFNICEELPGSRWVVCLNASCTNFNMFEEFRQSSWADLLTQLVHISIFVEELPHSRWVVFVDTSRTNCNILEDPAVFQISKRLVQISICLRGSRAPDVYCSVIF